MDAIRGFLCITWICIEQEIGKVHEWGLIVYICDVYFNDR